VYQGDGSFKAERMSCQRNVYASVNITAP